MLKMFWAVPLALVGLVLEWVGWMDSFSPLYGNDGSLIWYLGWHALGSAIFSLAMLAFFRSDMIRPRWAMYLLILAWCYALAILGFISVLASVVFIRFYKRPMNKNEFESVGLPDFDPHQRQGSSGFRQAGLKTFLGNSQVPVQSRLGAMVALQNVSSKVSAPMLREVLMDPEDDLRLLAYGMMDSQEKKINKSISEELNLLEQKTLSNGEAVSDEVRLGAVRRLGELYWELVYQDLAQGDLREHALRSSLKYCQQVLLVETDNAALHLRVGRLHHELNEFESAVVAYNKAINFGLPIVRILPYLAELEFERKDFTKAKDFMVQLAAWRSQPRLQPVIDYWNQG